MFTNLITNYNLDEEYKKENSEEEIYAIYNINERFLLLIHNSINNINYINNNQNNLLVIMNESSKITDKNIKNKEEKSRKIIKLLLKIKNKNNFDNIFLINLKTDNNNLNIALFKKILEICPNINILMTSGYNTNNNNNTKIVNEFKNILSSTNLIKCFGITKEECPLNLIQQPNKQKEIVDIIDNKNFNIYLFYKLK